MIEKTEKRVLTTKQIAEIFHVKAHTVREWLKLEKIKGIKIGRRWMIPVEEVERIIKEGV